MTIDTNFFRQVMGQLPTGVTIVTTQHQGQFSGLTVSAFCSVSLHPKLVLVCIDLSSTALPLIRESQSFAVNILSKEQEHISRFFAVSKQERQEYFRNNPYFTLETGAPILYNTLGFLDVRIIQEYPGGDHTIMLGQVEALGKGHQFESITSSGIQTITLPLLAQNTPTDNPLIHHRGQYQHLAEQLPAQHSEKISNMQV